MSDDGKVDSESTAYVFPGQGSQFPGMGREFHDAWPETRARFDELDTASESDLLERCFDADAETLRETSNAQPAVFATGVATCAGVLERAGRPDYVAGHSLGHITAATVAGMLDPEAGLELVTRRGELMERAALADGPGTMVAVLLADPDVVAAACEATDDVSVAAVNAPGQTVVSGTESAVSRVRSTIEGSTRARFVELDVGAAFHSPIMASASAPFADRLEATSLRTASIPIYSDVTAERYTAPSVARRDLRAQLTAPIDWVGVVETLAEQGVDRFVELPPAGTLVEFIDRIAPDAEAIALESPADIEELDDR